MVRLRSRPEETRVRLQEPRWDIGNANLNSPSDRKPQRQVAPPDPPKPRNEGRRRRRPESILWLIIEAFIVTVASVLFAYFMGYQSGDAVIFVMGFMTFWALSVSIRKHRKEEN